MNPLVISHRFFENVEKYPEKAALLSKIEGAYRPVTYRELGEIVRNVSMSLDSWGIKKGDRIAIISDNREEWIMSDLSNISIGAISVPIYPTLTFSQIGDLFKHSEPRVVFVATKDLWKKVLDTDYKFEHIVVFDKCLEENNVIMFETMKNEGKKLYSKSPDRFQTLLNAVNETNIACINYTSGTTGNPKGVMITNENFVSNADNGKKVIPISSSDIFLSFLPLSHVLERLGGYYTPILLGATIGFAESVDTVVDNMMEVRPTIMISVPRLFEKIYSAVISGVESGSLIKKKIFYWALRAGKMRMDKEIKNISLSKCQKRKIKIADKLVFSKLQAKTGARLQRFVSGGAPLSKEIAEFFFAAGLNIYEGYGLTETSPVITENGPGAIKLGSVGKTIPDTECKVAEDGEILVKGPQVMRGYYKDEDATREVMDNDGYLHTGDIGHFDDDGFLFLTDRKKNILVTAGGKNVSPQPIEESIKLSQYISEVVLIGDRRNFISTLIVLDQEIMKKWAEEHNIPFEPYNEFVKLSEVRTMIEVEIQNRTTYFSQFEKIKKFRIVPRDFTLEGGELTPSLKVRKKFVLEKYSYLINKMYSE